MGGRVNGIRVSHGPESENKSIDVETQESCISGLHAAWARRGRESLDAGSLHTPLQRRAATLRDGTATSEAREMGRENPTGSWQSGGIHVWFRQAHSLIGKVRESNCPAQESATTKFCARLIFGCFDGCCLGRFFLIINGRRRNTAREGRKKVRGPTTARQPPPMARFMLRIDGTGQWRGR